jgi:hypothetical protein
MLSFVLIQSGVTKKCIDFSFHLMIASNSVVSVARDDLGIFGMGCDLTLNELS